MKVKGVAGFIQWLKNKMPKPLPRETFPHMELDIDMPPGKEQERLCKTCKFMRSPGKFAKCIRLAVFTTGFEDGGDVFCSTERKMLSNDRCGKEGKFWEYK